MKSSQRVIPILFLCLLAAVHTCAQSSPAIVSTRGYINGTPLTAHTSTAFNSVGASTLVAFVSTNTPWNGLPVSITGLSDNAGNSWNLLAGPTTWAGNSFTLVSAIYYVNGPITSATATVTVNLSNPAPLVFHVFAVSGADITGPPISSAITNPGAGGTSASVATAPITVPADSLLLSWVKNETNATATAIDGYTLDAQQSTSFLWAESEAPLNAGSYSGQFQYDSAIGWQTAIVGLKPFNGPQAASQSVTTKFNTPVNITLTGISPQGFPLTYSVVAGPSVGTLSGIAPNLTYTPTPGYVGHDAFTFKVNDGTTDSNIATVSITVQGPVNIVGSIGYINSTPLTTHTSAAFSSVGSSTLVAFVSSHPSWNGLPVSINGLNDSAGNTWSVVTGPTVWAGSSFTLLSEIYYVNGPITSSTETVTASLSNPAPLVLHVFAVSGADITGVPIFSPITNPAGGTAASVMTAPIALPANGLLLSWVKNETSSSATAVGGYTLDAQQSTTFLWAEYETALNAGNYMGQFQYDSAIGWQTAIVGLKPPGSVVQPVFTATPANPTNQTSANFTFTDTQTGVSFLCQLDGSGFSACTSPSSYSGLSQGSHAFSVIAVDPSKNRSATVGFTWLISSTPPPAPTITSMPANPTNQTGASFSFTDTQAGVSFLCQLDGNAFSVCTSPSSYSGLSQGSHTFSVVAVDASTNQSAPASFTWTINTTPPPAPTITSAPANPTNQTSASFSFTDTQAGVSFLCQMDGAAFSACASPNAYAGLIQGSHTFSVKAQDTAGNLSAVASFTWTINTTPPPTPTITAKPANPTNLTTASFSFTDTQTGVSFLCQLDAGVFSACTSPKSYSGLSLSSHTFSVKAQDTAGNQSATASFTWTIQAVIIAFGQVAAATPQSSVATVSVTFPRAQSAGNLNVVVVGWNDTTSSVQSVKDSAGNSYNLAIGPTSGTALQQSIYYAANIVGGSNTVTVTFNQAAAFPDVRILEYSGVTTLDVIAGASGNSATANSGAATTTTPYELVFGADMVATVTKSAGSGFTSRIITSPDGDIAEDKIVTAAGSNSATAALGSAGSWVMQMVTFSSSPGPAPTVSSVSPNTGSTAGGTAVTITGTNFVAGATVAFGGTPATNVVVVLGTQITATTPPGSSGPVTVTVTNPGGQNGSLSNGFTYVAPPTIGSVSPNNGPTAGGTPVTITGANFASGATVTFGTAAATNVAVVSATQITATTPAGTAGTVTVKVTNPSGLSGSLTNGFTYGPPTVSSISPNDGPIAGGTSVTITGTRFVAGATVTFGTAAATNVVVVSATQITAATPAGTSGAVTVTATNPGGLSGSLTNGFTYGAPTVGSVSPNTGSTAGGTAVTITGTNFATGATVTFGTAAATGVVVASSTRITATTPAGTAGPVTVTVTDAGGQSGSLASGFTYGLVPNVSAVSPNNGPTTGGTPVTITGTNFTAGATVAFGTAAATNVVIVSATQITATTPAGTAGVATVKVTNPGGLNGSLTNGFTYGAPTVSAVSPNNGPTSGGTAVTINGSNFTTGATVTFGGNAATNVVVVSATQITATTPGGNAGAATVTVTNPGGLSGSLTNGFTYGAPTVSGVSPNTGSTAGGTAVTIAGTNFAAGATVTFGTTAATNVTVVSATQITATTPAGTAGAVIVTVTNPGGQSGSLANGFTYVVIPTVTSISPNNGPTGGGTAVTITGTNFATGAIVTFGATAATNVVVVTATQITATTPPGTAGAAAVTVTLNSQSGSLNNGFTYVAQPTVGSVSPSAGSTAGGTAVTIIGTNFASGATVTFGTAAATNVVVVSATQINATTPAGTSGSVTISVTNPGNLSASLANGFNYVIVPTVNSVSPNSGPAAGGTPVTITGTNFAAGATVTFGAAAAANVVVVSATQITATSPAGSPGAATVTVTLSGGQSGSLPNGFTYQSALAIGFGQVAAATPQSATATVTVTFPAVQTVGDLNIVVVGWNDTTSSVQLVKDSAGNTYNLAIGPTVGTALQQSIYYAANIVGGNNTVTVTFSQAAAFPDVRILEYRGVTTLDASAGASGNSAAANSGAATTTSSNELIFGANTIATVTTSAGAGFTSRIITSPDGDIAEDKMVTAAGSNSATANLNSAGPWVMQMVTFK